MDESHLDVLVMCVDLPVCASGFRLWALCFSSYASASQTCFYASAVLSHSLNCPMGDPGNRLTRRHQLQFGARCVVLKLHVLQRRSGFQRHALIALHVENRARVNDLSSRHTAQGRVNMFDEVKEAHNAWAF